MFCGCGGGAVERGAGGENDEEAGHDVNGGEGARGYKRSAFEDAKKDFDGRWRSLLNFGRAARGAEPGGREPQHRSRRAQGSAEGIRPTSNAVDLVERTRIAFSMALSKHR